MRNKYILNAALFLALATVIPTYQGHSQIVSTFAGSSNYGQTDGIGAAATFYQPFGITADANGNVYVADAITDRIRKISSSGQVTTLAGSDRGYVDATGSAAQFASPSSLAVDTSGNLYVADTNNNCIRKVTPNGTVTTLAGGTQGFADGMGTAARFYNPIGVAVDGVGNVFVADKFNNRIRKITPDGMVSTIAGWMTGLYLDTPFGVAVDAADNLYITDTYNNRIVKITSDGVASTLAGYNGQGNSDGPGNVARFFYPVDLDVDASGNVFVADTENNLIRKITPDGIVSTYAGSTQGFADGTGAAAKFSKPYGVAVDSQGVVFVADLVNHRIRRIVKDLGTGAFKTSNRLSVFPNPASKLLQVQFSELTPIDKMVISDFVGKIISESGNHPSEMDIQNLSNGTYLLTVYSREGKFQTRFVKQ